MISWCLWVLLHKYNSLHLHASVRFHCTFIQYFETSSAHLKLTTRSPPDHLQISSGHTSAHHQVTHSSLMHSTSAWGFFFRT